MECSRSKTNEQEAQKKGKQCALHLLSPSQHPPPQLRIHHPAHPKSRNAPSHPGDRATRPIPRDPGHPLSYAHARPVVEIQAPQLQRRAKHLAARRRQELRRAGPRNGLFGFLGDWEDGCDQGWEVEGGEDGEGVAQCEQGVAGLGHGAGSAHGWSAEATRKVLVFVEAE